MNKTAAAVVAAFVVASAWAAPAYVRHALRHGRPAADVLVPRPAPARMIEARSGLWVASYQCITGLGRGGRDCAPRN